MEKPFIRSVEQNDCFARFLIVGVEDIPGKAAIFNNLQAGH